MLLRIDEERNGHSPFFPRLFALSCVIGLAGPAAFCRAFTVLQHRSHHFPRSFVRSRFLNSRLHLHYTSEESAQKEDEAANDDAAVGARSSISDVLGIDSPKTIRNHNPARHESKPRRRRELSWCGRESCHGGEIREKVVGEHNHMEFEGPATGQVVYEWASDHNSMARSEGQKEDDSGIAPPSVLLLVKKDDKELAKVAAEAVKNLIALDIDVLLQPNLQAEISKTVDVENKKIKLFEPQVVPGYGGTHGDPLSHEPNEEVEVDLEKHRDRWSSSGCANPGPDLICTLGGDGLLMFASQLFQGPVPPIITIAGGSMGFLTDFSRDEMVYTIAAALGIAVEEVEEKSVDDESERLLGDGSAAVPARPVMALSHAGEKGSKGSGAASNIDYYEDDYLKPKFKFGAYNRICLSMRMRLDCHIINREGVVRARFSVLNEVVIDRGSSPYLANLECFCDDVHLTTVQADGVIFATPTGSTAYSMAAGGSVVHPAVPAILVTPICPHVLSFRSMVFPDHVVLRCYVPDDARSAASVAFDGKHRRSLHRGDSVQIQMSAHPVPTINRVDHSSDWLNSLKRNFNFNSRVRQSPL